MDNIHPIRAARHAKGLSNRQLAWELGIELYSFTQIGQIERGYYLPGPERCEKLAEILGFESGQQVRCLCEEWQKEHKKGKFDDC